MAGYRGSTELIKTERPRYLSPFEQMEKWFEEAWHRPFSLLTRAWPEKEIEEFESTMPSCDIYEEGNDFVLKADMPGMERKDIDINITDSVLTISGERHKEEKVEKGSYYRYERSHGSFFRRFELPSDVDTEKVKAHLENGVLEIRLPKTDEAWSRAKKISIS